MGKLIKDSFLLLVLGGVVLFVLVVLVALGVLGSDTSASNTLNAAWKVLVLIPLLIVVVELIAILGFELPTKLSTPDEKVLLSSGTSLGIGAIKQEHGKLFLTSSRLVYKESVVSAVFKMSRPRGIVFQFRDPLEIGVNTFWGMKQGLRIISNGHSYSFGLINPEKWQRAISEMLYQKPALISEPLPGEEKPANGAPEPPPLTDGVPPRKRGRKPTVDKQPSKAPPLTQGEPPRKRGRKPAVDKQPPEAPPLTQGVPPRKRGRKPAVDKHPRPSEPGQL